MSNHPTNQDPSEQGVSTHDSAETGESLQELIDRVGPLPWELVSWFALRISELLEPLHAKGLIHGKISPQAICLSRPWPDHEVVLNMGDFLTGSSANDLRDLGETMEWLLFRGETQAENLAADAQEAGRIISALADGRIPDARTLSAILLDSLAAENQVLDLPIDASKPSREKSESERDPTPVRGKPEPWKIAAAAAAVIFVGAGLYFMFKPDGNGASNRIVEGQAPAGKSAEASTPSDDAEQLAATEEMARELAEKEAAAKRLAAKEAEERERERERVAREQAEKEEAAREQAAMKEAAIKAAEEKAIQDEALVSRNEKIIEDPEASSEQKEQAFSELLTLAREENVKAVELCGASYWQGNGVAKDREKARAWFEKGASLGNARSMLGLGYCYDLAVGGPQDMSKAVEWWTKAANLGYEVAMSRLGDHYYLNPKAKNMEKAIEWWKKAAEAKSPSADAMTNLGTIYARGIETGKDLEKAEKWWRMAADLGATIAMTELGIVYINGDIEGKEEEAFPLFLKAAEAGSIRAMYGLEVCFRQGIGTGKNSAEADRWGRLALEKKKAADR